MGTTTNYGLRYPEPTDLLGSGHAQVRSLATDTDAALKAVANQAAADLAAKTAPYRRIQRGRETFTNIPIPGQSRTRTVEFATPFPSELAIPRVAVGCGGDARVNDLPFVAVIDAVTHGGFAVLIYPLATGGGTGFITGTEITVDWIAAGID